MRTQGVAAVCIFGKREYNPAVVSDPIRHQYKKYGVKGYYAKHAAEYRNPHEQIIARALEQAVDQWNLPLTSVLDLACGSGEATLALVARGAENIQGIDPFTADAYRNRTGHMAEAFSFEQIAGGALAGRRYRLIVCSFAMHLIDASWLPALLAQLRTISDRLLILTPHKRPQIKTAWGWNLEEEFVLERVRVRLYRAAENVTSRVE